MHLPGPDNYYRYMLPAYTNDMNTMSPAIGHGMAGLHGYQSPPSLSTVPSHSRSLNSNLVTSPSKSIIMAPNKRVSSPGIRILQKGDEVLDLFSCMIILVAALSLSE